MSYKIVLYGRLGDLVAGKNLTLAAEAPQPGNWILDETGRHIAALHPGLETEVTGALAVSALADDARIMAKDQIIPFGMIHVIPPVNGG